MASGTCRGGNQPVRAFIDRFVGKSVANHVVEHNAASCTISLTHSLAPSEVITIGTRTSRMSMSYFRRTLEPARSVHREGADGVRVGCVMVGKLRVIRSSHSRAPALNAVEAGNGGNARLALCDDQIRMEIMNKGAGI